MMLLLLWVQDTKVHLSFTCWLMQELPEQLLGTVRFSRLDLAAGWYLDVDSGRLWRSREESVAAKSKETVSAG